MNDILTKIIDARKADIASLGFTFGNDIPPERMRAVHPFLAGCDGSKKRGVILEVKRASPSKGDIAPELNAAETARSYAECGASAISCLTETNYFKGTLADLKNVCNAVDEFARQTGRPAPAVLRKDFLLSAEEIEIAYRAGADAVLLIARILSEDTLLDMARKVLSLGMSALVEVRSDEDVAKIARVFSEPDLQSHTGSDGNFVFGVNSRDLSNFKIDLMHPVVMRKKIREAVRCGSAGEVRVIFESGVTNVQCAKAVGSMGFSGLLLGEAAAKNPELRGSLVESFCSAVPVRNAEFVNQLADMLTEAGEANILSRRPTSAQTQNTPRKSTLVKICGLTRIQDALTAQTLGADFLGFVFADAFPRSVTHDGRLEKILADINKLTAKKVAVIVDTSSPEAERAIELVKDGIFDVLQFHNIPYENISREFLELPHYFAVKTFAEYEELLSKGEMRVLLDSKDFIRNAETLPAPTEPSPEAKWLAGGITPENTASIIADFHPELIDVSGGVEESSLPGIKIESKLKELFENVR